MPCFTNSKKAILSLGWLQVKRYRKQVQMHFRWIYQKRKSAMRVKDNAAYHITTEGCLVDRPWNTFDSFTASPCQTNLNFSESNHWGIVYIHQQEEHKDGKWWILDMQHTLYWRHSYAMFTSKIETIIFRKQREGGSVGQEGDLSLCPFKWGFMPIFTFAR